MKDILIPPVRDSDRKHIVRLMNDFQKYLIHIDTFHCLRRHPHFGSSYIRRMIARVKKHGGIIFVAEQRRGIIGFIAGVFQVQIKADALEYRPMRKARLIELYVAARYRGKGVGFQLMKCAEEYFKKHKCDRLELGVDAFNTAAHDYYLRLGYCDRNIDMWKDL